jgi:membrane glycosyltransferase
MRAGMRIWATALAWWQGDESSYWGHNAVLRIAPFRDHCHLPLLPGGRHILSHDQIEAAMLAGAGWGVRLIPEEDGSAEANPPALPEFLRRELRWLAGNFEYRHLLTMPGLRPMGRWHLIQAILLFGCAPLYLVFLIAAGWAAATDHESPFPAAAALAVTLGWAGALHAPKLLGYVELLLSSRKRAAYGGAARIINGAALETVFVLLMDPIMIVIKTIAIIRLALGVRAEWSPQNRSVRGVPWSEAVRLFWPHTLMGLLAFAALACSGPTACLWAAPLAGGLVVSIPFCVFTAHPDVSAWMRQRALAATPEELAARGSAYSAGRDGAES